jgi:alpha-1,2-mannosyltransferase
MAAAQEARRTTERTVALPVAAALLVTQAVVLVIWPAAHLLMIDLQVYRAGGEAVLRGTRLYDGGILLDLPFVYPPFAAVVFAPLTVLPVAVLKVLWTVLNLALVVFVARRSVVVMGMPLGAAPTALLVAVVLALDPVRTTLYLGQINMVLLALVLADLTGRRSSRWRGVGVGLAAAVKLTPLIFVAYLLLVGRLRAAATAMLTFAAAIGLGFLLAPADSVVYWVQGTFAAANRISDVAATTNQSWGGLLARADAPSWTYPVGAIAIGAGGLAVAVRVHRRADELLALTLCGLLSAAVAPFAWSHHFVWVAPLAVLLAQHAAAGSRAAAAALAVLLLVTVAWITGLPGPGVGPIPSTGLISLLPDVYLLGVVSAVAAAAWLTRPAATG